MLYAAAQDPERKNGSLKSKLVFVWRISHQSLKDNTIKSYAVFVSEKKYKVV